MKITEAVLDFATPSLTVRLESERDVQTAYDRLKSESPQLPTYGTPVGRLTVEDIVPAVYALCKTGNLIPAIKLYRLVTGQGLKESKRACEAIYAENPRML